MERCTFTISIWTIIHRARHHYFDYLYHIFCSSHNNLSRTSRKENKEDSHQFINKKIGHLNASKVETQLSN